MSFGELGKGVSDSSPKQSTTEVVSSFLWPYHIIRDKIPNYSLNINVNNIAFCQPKTSEYKYVFTEEGKKVLNTIDKWLKAECWYESKGIRYYRGLGLYGKSGTGKSSLVLEVARNLKIPIWIFDTSSFDNQEFEETINELPAETGIILFEDLDVLWSGRTNKVKSEYNTLTFDCFINKLSGVNAIKNKFVVITTNHKEELDEALIRKGRIDELIELKSLNKEEKLKMAKIILENNDLAAKITEEGINDTTAEFENRLVDFCLINYWKE